MKNTLKSMTDAIESFPDEDNLTFLPWPCHARMLELLPLRSRLILSVVSKYFHDLVSRDILRVSSLDVNDLYGQKASSCLAWALRTSLASLCKITASGSSCLEPLLVASQVPAGQATLRQLTSLRLDSLHQMQDKHLCVLLVACPNLQTLALPGCGKLTDISASAIGALLPRLREVSFRDWTSVTDGGVVALASGCPHLEDVTLDGCFRVGTEALCTLARCCSQLRRLSITKSYGVTGAALAALGNHGVACLEELCLRQCPRVAAVGRLGSCIHLRVIDLSGCSSVGGPALLEMLAGCGGCLVSLQLSGCVGLLGEVLEGVGRRCPRLQELNVRGLALNDGHLKVLAVSCTTLRSLCLAWCTRLTEEGLQPLLARNPGLQDLDIEALYLLTDTFLNFLGQHTPLLARLCIRMCHRMSTEAIVGLVAATEVRTLLVSGIMDESGTTELVRSVKQVRTDCELNW